MKNIAVSDRVYKKLIKQKDSEGYSSKSWDSWLATKASPNLSSTNAEVIGKVTRLTLRRMWGNNIGFNLEYVRRMDMKTLRDIPSLNGQKVLVVGGGPSIHTHNQIETLSKASREGVVIVCCDKELIPLLRAGVVPDYCISVDGSPIIADFFKHDAVAKSVSQIKFILHLAVSPDVTNYLYSINANVYWFLAYQVYREPDDDIVTMVAMTETDKHKGIVTLPTGGNCGVAAWSFAMVILHARQIGLIGFDMGYPEGTPLESTPYYSTFIASCKSGAIATAAYEKLYNPAWRCYGFTDHVFSAYRLQFCDLLGVMPNNIEVTSCVEGGLLYHKRLKYSPLKDWLPA